MPKKLTEKLTEKQFDAKVKEIIKSFPLVNRGGRPNLNSAFLIGEAVRRLYGSKKTK